MTNRYSLKGRAILSGLTGLTLWVMVPVAHAGVEVFTLAGMPVTNAPANAAIVELDAGARLDAEVSENLSDDPDQAAAEMESRMKSSNWNAIRDEYGKAYTGLTRAWQLGVQKVPAVVVDDQFVVYGQPDIGKAVAEIARARGNTQ